MQTSCIQHDYLLWTAGGFYVCYVLTEIFTPYLSAHWWPGYRRLRRDVLLDWNARMTSTVHATLICITSSWCLAYHTDLWTNKLFGTDYMSQACLCLSCGYMIYDMVTITFYTKGFPLFTYLIHHTVAVFGSWMILVNQLGMFYIHYKLLTELSTPLLNLRWFIRQVGYPAKHPASSVTTLVAAFIFVSVRIFGSIPFWIWLHRSINELESETLRQTVNSYRIPVYCFCISLDVLNTVWSLLILKRCWMSVCDLKRYYLSHNSSDT
ncbi:Transmembrane protein 56 [Paragonimus heterotremus]|uniref:Transmembrane protein 56 n=1 Tax=Paragonimus heterotremus TaxID=100268 RepID=A0A8J4WJR5_9TREM|nr:Transmembrane protein 56 [Paragonimus heterotremus]